MTTSKDYIVLETLHSGANGEVTVALSRKGKKKVVLKKIDPNKVDKEFIYNEISIGRKMKHPNIVRMLSSWTETKFFFLEVEFIEGYDLFTFMEHRNFVPLSEKQCRKLFRQLVNAIQYLHKHNVAHRDLKLENVILGKNGTVKVIDFGMAEEVKSKLQISNRWCGSTDYVCPEILTRTPYSAFKADVWCLGVILYTLLYSEFPFLWKDRVEAYQKLLPHPTPDYPENINLSTDARNLLEGMLSVDPKKRFALDDVRKHKWLRGKTFKFWN
jgi:serine/threonine protein kinase